MRKNKIILFFVILIFSNIFVNFLNFYQYNLSFQNNKSNIKIENKPYLNSNLLTFSNSESNGGNLTEIRMISISDPGGELPFNNLSYYYQSFIGSNLSMWFILIDKDFNNNTILDENNQATYSIFYNKTSGFIENGTLNNHIKFNNISNTFSGIIETSALSKEGNYTIEINMDLLDYEIQPYIFNLTIIEKFELDISINKPNQIIAGEKLYISVLTPYIYKSEIFHLGGVLIDFTLYLNNKNYIYRFTGKTNELGTVTFTLILPLNTKDISFDVETPEEYNHESTKIIGFNIKVITYSEFIKILSFYIVIVISFMITIILILLKLVIPKKSEKERFLKKSKQTFEDILKLEHIFILHKNTREFLLYKSYISKEINSEMLKEFKNFISSLNNFTNFQNSLNEINYKNKILLLAEGKYIILYVILNRKVSTIFKKKLKEFLIYIEQIYNNELPRGNTQSISFEEVESIFENILNLSIMLPHRIQWDIFDLSLLTNPYSIDIYEITDNLVKKTGKNFFYLSKIFFEFSKQTGKGVAEFLISVRELKAKYILKPIKTVKAN